MHGSTKILRGNFPGKFLSKHGWRVSWWEFSGLEFSEGILLAGNFRDCRGRNGGRLPPKTGSNYHLADSVDVKMLEKSRIKTINFWKMIVNCFT